MDDFIRYATVHLQDIIWHRTGIPMKHLQLEDSSNVIWIYLSIDFQCKISPHRVERQQAIKQTLSFPVT